MYICGKCGKTFDELPKGIIRCPSCAYKVLYRARDPITKKIKAE